MIDKLRLGFKSSLTIGPCQLAKVHVYPHTSEHNYQKHHDGSHRDGGCLQRRRVHKVGNCARRRCPEGDGA